MTHHSADLWEHARQAAARAALQAWQAIQPLYEGSYKIEYKGVDDPCTEADKLADRLIVEALSKHFAAPDFAYLTEESEDRRQRLDRPGVWIIDPIDGTKDFIRHTGNFAVHIALVERLADGNYHPVAAVVYRPLAGQLYSAVHQRGAWLHEINDPCPNDAQLAPAQGRRLQVSPRDRLARMRSVVSNANATSRLTRFIQSLNLEDYWHIGSLGIKLCQIAEGAAELYVNLSRGKAKEWDTCAPQLILEEAGGKITDLQGRPIHYNCPDVYHQHGLLATNGQQHVQLLQKISAFLAAEGATR